MSKAKERHAKKINLRHAKLYEEQLKLMTQAEENRPRVSPVYMAVRRALERR